MRRRAGFIIMDTAVVYIVVSYTVVVMATVFILTLKASPTLEQTLVTGQLAHELLEEVQTRPWDATSPSTRPGYPAYAQTAVSTATATSKAAITNIGQFNDWTESPPQDPAGNALSGLGGYQRSVTVAYVSTTTFASSATPTDYKLVTVCAQYTRTGNQTCLEWVATRK